MDGNDSRKETENETKAHETLRRDVMRPLARRFPGKEELIELVALSLVAAENLLVVGPPGTAKSEVVSGFASRIQGRYFEYLLTRFTEPAEIFGPVDIGQLRQGKLVTCTEHMLPEAEIAFLDEIFNAGSAILNSLLGIINDGVFRRGNETRSTALISVVAATNRVPEEPSLRALQDRFTLRVEVGSLDEDRLDDLLEAGWAIERERLQEAASSKTRAAPVTTRLLHEMHRAVAAVDLSRIRRPLAELVRRTRAAGLFVSDRRAVKLQRLCAASAVLCGRREALPSDLWPARYLWERRDDQEALSELVGELSTGDVDVDTDPASDASPAIHPLASEQTRPAELLERLGEIEREIRRLEERTDGQESAPPRAAPGAEHEADRLHNQLYDLNSERRWCRARTRQEASELEELGERLESLVEVLERREAGE